LRLLSDGQACVRADFDSSANQTPAAGQDANPATNAGSGHATEPTGVDRFRTLSFRRWRNNLGAGQMPILGLRARLVFQRVTIDPQNSDVVYMPNVALYRSEDAGRQFRSCAGAPGGDDYHHIWVDPANSRAWFSDGPGTSISLDRGKTWSRWLHQPTAQLYHVTTTTSFLTRCMARSRDSDAVAVARPHQPRSDHASRLGSAGASESGYMIVDPKDPDVII